MELTDEGRALRDQSVRQFSRVWGLILVVLAAVPSLVALLSQPAGSLYLGHPYNTDDHMVYAAWMRQAMDGHFLFDNRFTTDPQAGITIHLLFLVLGWIAKITGYESVILVARLVLGYLFVQLLSRFIRKTDWDGFTCKMALTLATVGGGVGFLVWQTFGVALHSGLEGPLGKLLRGSLPVDVWQPEAFAFPSMLTSVLFMASACLILLVLFSFVQARESSKPVLGGFIAMLVLANIHSYDVVILVAIAIVGAVQAAMTRRLNAGWFLRSAIICSGAIPSGLWYLHVLRSDPVFRARAATETFSPDVRAIVAGLLPAIVLACFAMAWHRRRDQEAAGALALGVLALTLCLIPAATPGGYVLNWALWAVAMLTAIAISALCAAENTVESLIRGWAILAIPLPFMPVLFQRKLLMLAAIPFMLLAAVGLTTILKRLDRAPRNLVAILAILVFSASSIQWLFREFYFIRNNVSNTTVHRVFVRPDTVRVIREILADPRPRKVVLAMPGVPSPTADPDRYLSPTISDLNPIVSGLAGAYSIAGHWSETPNYIQNRNDCSKFFLAGTSDSERRSLIERHKLDYIVAPKRELFSDLAIADVRSYGEVVFEGGNLILIAIRR